MLRVLLTAALMTGFAFAGIDSLFDVNTIYVDTLGPDPAAALIRDKIINRLAASGKVSVTLDPAKADAILTGTVVEAPLTSYSNGTGGTGFTATGAVRVLNKEQRILWASTDAKRKWRPPVPTFRAQQSASSGLAEWISDSLLNALSPPKKHR